MIAALALRQDVLVASVAAWWLVMMMAMMPGFGGSFGDAATDQKSCGDKASAVRDWV